MTPRDTLNELAAVLAERSIAYGPAEAGFATIAALWSVVLGIRIQPRMVPLLLGLVKVARLARDPGHADSWLDLAGYGVLGASIAEPKGPPDE